jgi:hypothetical protein
MFWCRNTLKISKGGNQKSYIEGQTIQWPKENGQTKDRHDITEILLRVVLSTINKTKQNHSTCIAFTYIDYGV